MEVRLEQLAELINGEIVGDPNFVVERAAPLHAADERAITFAEKPEKLDWSQVTKARAVVVPKNASTDPFEKFALLRVDDVKSSFEKIALLFRPKREELVPKGVSEKASIAPSAKLGANVSIGAFASIGEDVVVGANTVIHSGVVLLPGVVVGSNTTIFPNVVIYENCVVGSNCILHANSVVGAFGFGYDSSSGVHILASQIGNVVVEDDVEVGACATIDRGAYDSTVIGEGTKIDNHVMIAHNCKIGKRNMICASVGIAGSVTTGDYVVMAGRVGVRDHVAIGEGAILGAMAGVMGSVPPGAKIVGIPATPEKEQMRKQVAFSRLPDALKELKALRKEFDALKKKLETQEN